MNAAQSLPPATDTDIPLPPIVAPADRVNVRLQGAFQFDYGVEIPKRKGRPPKGMEAPGIPFSRFPPPKVIDGKVAYPSYFVRGGVQSTVSAAAVAFRKRFEDVMFVTHWFAKDPQTGQSGVRVWRTR